MKKVIRLTEQDLERMVRRIIKESDEDTGEEPRETKYDESPYADEEHPHRSTKGDESADDFMDDVDVDNGLLQKIKSLNPMKSKSKSNRIKYYNNNVELVAIKDKDMLMISGYYFLSDLGWRPTTWSISSPLNREMTESFKTLWNQHMSPVETVRIFDHKPEQLKGALVAKPNIDTTSDVFNQLDYMDEFKKPNMLQRLKKQGKDLLNIEDNSDRETLDTIYAMIKKGKVDSIRKQDNYGITAYVNNKALIVDKETPEIIYAGKTLDISDLEMEADSLYFELLSV